MTPQPASDASRPARLILALPHLTTTGVVLLIASALLVIGVTGGYLRLIALRRHREAPKAVRLVNWATDRAVDAVKRPLTVAVLDQVVSVLRTGHYAQNVAAALDENHMALKRMLTEKVLADPAAARSVGRLPFSGRVVEEVADAALRVVFDVLVDPRTDELVSDMLRDNINQIRHDVAGASG